MNRGYGPRKVYSYKRTDRSGPLSFSYLVMADDAWPCGFLVGVANTLWGARRLAKRTSWKTTGDPVEIKL